MGRLSIDRVDYDQAQHSPDVGSILLPPRFPDWDAYLGPLGLSSLGVDFDFFWQALHAKMLTTGTSSDKAERIWRGFLAFFGFKPDSNFAVVGGMPRLRFSRVKDLTVADPETGPRPAASDIHVVPSDYYEYAGTGGFIDLPAVVPNAGVWPNPRVLNAYRIIRKDTRAVFWPRGNVGDNSSYGRKYALLAQTGDFTFPEAADPGLTNGSGQMASASGVDYIVQLGHVEPSPLVSSSTQTLSVGPQRWPA